MGLEGAGGFAKFQRQASEGCAGFVARFGVSEAEFRLAMIGAAQVHEGGKDGFGLLRP